MTVTPDSVQSLLASADHGDRFRGINQLRLLDPAIAFELLQTVVADKNPRVRYAALSQMGTLGTQDRQKAATILRDFLLNDDDTDVKSAAADALGALQIKEAFADLKQVYEGTNEWLIQLSIVSVLGSLGEPEAFPLLAAALNSETELVQTMAISALGELGDRRAIELLIPLADHYDWQMRHRVAQSLAQLGGEEVKSTLNRLAQDSVEVVANVAKEGL
jgi:HEAT repeat protein